MILIDGVSGLSFLWQHVSYRGAGILALVWVTPLMLAWFTLEYLGPRTARVFCGFSAALSASLLAAWEWTYWDNALHPEAMLTANGTQVTNAGRLLGHTAPIILAVVVPNLLAMPLFIRYVSMMRSS